MKISEKIIYFGVLGGLLANLLAGCATTAVEDDSPPEAQFAEGERLLKRGRYLEASERFRILKNRHPYSIYAALSALRSGDAYFEQETYIEAAGAYKVFLELYPKHPQADYAVYRMGESYYRQVPDSIDRDLDSASTGILTFQRLQKEFPQSQYVAAAQKMERELRSMLAEKEEYIGDFYFRQEEYLAAVGRYRTIVAEYPATAQTEKALYRLAFAYEKMGDKAKAAEALEKLKQDFPNGKFAGDAGALAKRLEQQN